MAAIYKRELRSYLVTPSGYVFLAIFYMMAGYYFYGYNLMGATTDFSYLFSSLFSFAVFLTPLLTMKLFSEERRYKTDQALLTAPVSLASIVFGKFFAALTIFETAQAVTLIYLLVIGTKGPVEYGVFFGHFIGMFLLGAALCALGMFVSSVTESQVIAAVGGMGLGLVFILIDSVGQLSQEPVLNRVCNAISFVQHYQDFTMGLLNIASVIFYLSVTALFLFLTARTLEKRRWG